MIDRLTTYYLGSSVPNHTEQPNWWTTPQIKQPFTNAAPLRYDVIVPHQGGEVVFDSHEMPLITYDQPPLTLTQTHQILEINRQTVTISLNRQKGILPQPWQLRLGDTKVIGTTNHHELLFQLLQEPELSDLCFMLINIDAHHDLGYHGFNQQTVTIANFVEWGSQLGLWDTYAWVIAPQSSLPTHPTRTWPQVYHPSKLRQAISNTFTSANPDRRGIVTLDADFFGSWDTHDFDPHLAELLMAELTDALIEHWGDIAVFHITDSPEYVVKSSEQLQYIYQLLAAALEEIATEVT